MGRAAGQVCQRRSRARIEAAPDLRGVRVQHRATVGCEVKARIGLSGSAVWERERCLQLSRGCEDAERELVVENIEIAVWCDQESRIACLARDRRDRSHQVE